MRWHTFVGLAAFAMVAAPQAARGQDTRPAIAVLAFENGGSYGQDAEVFDALRVGLQQMLLTELSQNGNLRIVDRATLGDVVAEQDLGASGRVDASTAARLGKIVGARYFILGSFIDFYGDFRIDARIVNVETTEIIKTQRVRDQREKLYDMIVDLASSIMQDVNLPPLAPAVRESREAREIPAEATVLYSRALFYKDRGLNEQAIQLFQQVQAEFPQLTEATEELRQLQNPRG
jgi:TolB-like protein